MNFNTPTIHACIDQVIADPCGSGTMADDARVELSQLLDHIKALKEQQARTDKVLADSVHGVKQTLAWNKRLDELQAENKALKQRIIDQDVLGF
jgi:ribonuclease HI